MTWETIPLKRIATFAAGGTPAVDEGQYWADQDDGYPWVAIGDMSGVDVVATTARRITHSGLLSARIKLGKPRTILFSMYATLGHTAWLAAPAAWNQAILGLWPTIATDARFLRYSLMSIRPQLLEQVRSNTQANLNAEIVGNLRLPHPPLDDQRRIADFLDAETVRIDELVRLRNLQVDRLAEALRNEAGRIMDPGWQLLPLRRIVDSVQTGATPTQILLPADSDNVPWYTPAALGGNLDLNSADKSVSKDDFSAVPRFPAESILIVGIGESLGKVADLDHEATGNQQLTAVMISGSADRRFVLWRLFAAYDEIRAWAQYSRIRILNNEILKSFRIPLPELREQIEIRQNLDHRLAEFTRFRDAAARFSRLASERRQALITAAVTGGITV